MKPVRIAGTLALVIASLGGCGSTQKASPIEYNYQIDNARANGIVQVFDLSGNTVVQIRGLDAATTHFFDQRNVEIPHRVVGENVVLKGILPSFTVSTATAASRVIRTVPVPYAMAAIQQPAGGTVAAGSSGLAQTGTSDEMTNEQLLTEIARIKKEIAALKGVIAAASAENAAALPPAHVATSAAPDSNANTDDVKAAQHDGEVVRVSFKDNSQSFRPNAEARIRILGLVNKARVVEVTGYTDSMQPTAVSEALAKGRAEAARRYLIRRGIDSKKITVDFSPAGKFISENETEKGKATNRRVEIRAS